MAGKIAPLTEQEVERVRWHMAAYGWIRRLFDGEVTEDQIREAVDRCPEAYREHFRDWLNRYRRKFKAARRGKRLEP